MGVTIKVNGMFNSLVHKGSGGMAISTPPDVCKTPSPGGPVPIPYVIISRSGDLKKGTKTVKVDGKKMAANKGSEFSRCMGDEPGTAKGLISQTNMKEATWILYSFDVKLEGKNACRLMDKMFMNHKNTASLCGEIQGPVILVDFSKVGSTQEEACAEYEKTKVDDHDQTAADAGIVKEDYDAMRKVTGEENCLASFRDTNPACQKHLKQGRIDGHIFDAQGNKLPEIESKGHDILTKSFEKGNIPTEYEDEFLGLISDLDKKEWCPNPADHLATRDGVPVRVTGDYDMHDMISSSGSRIRGGSAKENKVIDAMNSAFPGELPRVRHGCQANYGDYWREHQNEKRIDVLFQPDTNRGDPITVMDGTKGNPADVHRLHTNEDVANMYKCKGADMPPEWNVQPMSPFQRLVKKVKSFFGR